MRQKIRTKKIMGCKNKQRFASGIVSHITAKGFWLRVSNKDYFIPRSEHRRFRSASIAESLDVVVDRCDECTDDDFYLKWKRLKISTRIVRALYSFFFFSAEKNEPPHVHMRDMLDGAQAVNVSEITENGFWLHIPDKDYYVSYKEFPWFRIVTEEEIQDVVIYIDGYSGDHGHHLHWKLF